MCGHIHRGGESCWRGAQKGRAWLPDRVSPHPVLLLRLGLSLGSVLALLTLLPDLNLTPLEGSLWRGGLSEGGSPPSLFIPVPRGPWASLISRW